ncbi:MgtC/SapB family protein [Desulfobaculum bizertense]|uniref:Putative Mg2+ transporter-C (MgtC) family protein n=1 Tax=Desulfobaculum bizertense DSM 18034 TaxID=1121442 RepID=A0A1T4WCC0_9BACT|nr:MgtC/SapB family protein [Desulfobaculum bizertense]UIJ37545.1 MgtC/SapB family protein [Desulfobaculum bizertense]SKA74351.1 putative Mg2+ transporter-C (MgtC) family protein [Desulfobaculum bizertense DSM 18034]
MMIDIFGGITLPLDRWGLILGKLVLAGALGALIGYEREAHGQAAGFRTNILVALGACLMMMLSVEMEVKYRHLTQLSVVRLDPSRIASYAIASMGFLGAGAIIKGRGTVRGLTTAASLWMVTGLGLCVGAGYYAPAVIVTFLSLALLSTLGHKFARTICKDLHSVLEIKCHCPLTTLRNIRNVLEMYGVRILTVNCSRNMEDGLATYRLRLLSKDDIPRAQIMGDLLQLEGLESLSWGEADVP